MLTKEHKLLIAHALCSCSIKSFFENIDQLGELADHPEAWEEVEQFVKECRATLLQHVQQTVTERPLPEPNLLGRIVKLKEYTLRTENLTVVPYRVLFDADGDSYYDCIIVRGKLLSGQGVGATFHYSPSRLAEEGTICDVKDPEV